MVDREICAIAAILRSGTCPVWKRVERALALVVMRCSTSSTGGGASGVGVRPGRQDCCHCRFTSYLVSSPHCGVFVFMSSIERPLSPFTCIIQPLHLGSALIDPGANLKDDKLSRCCNVVFTFHNTITS